MAKHKPEFTDEMFEEFQISEEERIEQAAWSVWTNLDWNANKEEIENFAYWYNITYQDAIKWKRYYMSRIKN